MRLLCAVVLAGALMGGLAALWVLDHQRLRHDYLVARRATAGAVTAVRDASAANQGVGEAFKTTTANGLAVRLRVLRSQASDAPRTVVRRMGNAAPQARRPLRVDLAGLSVMRPARCSAAAGATPGARSHPRGIRCR
jgi:hypothetical protein